MNLLKLRKQARLKSSVSVQNYSNADLDDQIDIAYKILARKAAILNEDFYEEQRATFNLIGNSSLYSLPRSSIAVKQVRLAYSTPSSDSDYNIATSYDPSEVRNVSADEETVPISNPIVDYTGDYFRIKPTPTSDIAAGGKIYYIEMPSAMVVTGDSPVLPRTINQDLIATYAAIQMCAKYNKTKKYRIYKLEWDEAMDVMDEDISGRDMNEDLRFLGPHAGMGETRRTELPPREL